MSSTVHGQVVGYMRVSSKDQNLTRQQEALGTVEGVGKVFSDRLSGKNTDREGLRECLDYVREGDLLVVASMDRLARSLVDLLDVVDGLTGRGIAVKFLSEGLTFGGAKADPVARLTLQVMGAVAEFERAIINERQAEGVAAAKARGGVYKGRKPIDPAKVEEAAALVAGGVPLAEAARRVSVSRRTLYRYGVRAAA